MARPDPKPFDPAKVKSEAEYAKEAVADARHSAESGRGRVNRDENTGDTGGAARHTVTDTVADKKR